MWPETDDDRELIRDLARTVVGEVAAEELAGFEVFIDDYFENLERPEGEGASDEALGSGLLDPALISQVVAYATGAGLMLLLQALRDAVKDEFKELSKMVLKRLLRRTPQPGESMTVHSKQDNAPPSLVLNVSINHMTIVTEVSMVQLAETVQQAIRQCGVPEARVEEIAGAVVRQLVQPTDEN